MTPIYFLYQRELMAPKVLMEPHQYLQCSGKEIIDFCQNLTCTRTYMFEKILVSYAPSFYKLITCVKISIIVVPLITRHIETPRFI